MDTKKLDKWADLLLDTGKRNNLINFKDSKKLTVEVLLPSPDVLFEKIDSGTVFEVYDPKIIEDEADELEVEGKKLEQLQLDNLDMQDEHDAKTSYLAEYSKKIKRQNQALLYNGQSNPIQALKSIEKKAREYIEETGVHVAYMAFGFIHWKESDSSHTFFRAPILLIPIRLERASSVDPFYLQSTEDDIIVNPTFSYKLDAEHGVKLPEYNDEGLAEYLESVRHIVSKLGWTVSNECKIGIFSFLKINMYRDLKDNANVILKNSNVLRLLGEPVASPYMVNDLENPTKLKNPLIELHSVVDADSSQMEAIEMARMGTSFVLQGPPGTGKSQTITNIIAECLSDGKKILFVSEKLAALNVVYEKLKKAGLQEYCLELHSHKANKKDVIEEICHTLRADKSAVSAKADNEIAMKDRARRQLDIYAQELHMERPIIEKSVYQLYESYAALRTHPDVDWIEPYFVTQDEIYLKEVSLLLEQFVEYIPSVGYDYRKNPWYGYINQDTSYQSKAEVKSNLTTVIQFFESLIPLLQEISATFKIDCEKIEDALFWKEFLAFAADSKVLTPNLLVQNRFDDCYAMLDLAKRKCADIVSTRSQIDAVYDQSIYGINAERYYNLLIKEYSGALSRLFNSEYKGILKELRLCKKNGEKLSYNEATEITKRLLNYKQITAQFMDEIASIKDDLGSMFDGIETDWDAIKEEMNTLQGFLSKNVSFGALVSNPDFIAKRDTLKSLSNRLNALLENSIEDNLKVVSSYFDASLFDVNATNSPELLKRLHDCLGEMDKLDNWCHFRTLLSKLEEKQVISYLDVAISQNIEPTHMVGAFQKLFYYQWIDNILSDSDILAAFNRISQDKAIRTFCSKDVEQFDINKAKIRAELSAKRPSLDMIASGSALATLLREGEKKRKQKSIRSLLIETGELVQRIKPCFLMSPLSVSTFLAANAIHFDVVIFDEASQIFPQDAIGAIYRAKQLIVVGDSKQMPPSNFFNATIETEDNDEETGDVTDFESILDLCSTSMPQLRLRWHYRSRFEQLITFSNKNFYDNDLVTFPSPKADVPGCGVDYFHVDGIFDRKSHTNRKEAEFVVDLIYQNIERYPHRSLGVVAFSVAQQDLIDKLLSIRRQETPELEFFFKNDGNEPFFIKNLETVQGDERDTIIFSIAYGKDEQGRLLHNFGPLNRMGGERRLNVAITRAKTNVQLVSSMRYTDIDLKRTSSEGAKLLRDYLDFAENGTIALERSFKVNAFEHFDSEFELEVCDFLRQNGFSVDTQVGCSGFRIDLGLKRPDSSDYVLAIECDGATYHSSKNARDRDRLRQEILERMGWKFYRIWSTDWFRNKTVEKERLLCAATEAILVPPEEEIVPVKKQKKKNFEVAVKESTFSFPPYIMADMTMLKNHTPAYSLCALVKEILLFEAPLAEALLLKRIAWFFGREKVTSLVQKSFEEGMKYCDRYGIIRRNGFLYLESQQEILFREHGDLDRDMKQIAPEELAAGMLEILKQNYSVDKTGLYRTLASHCGLNRLTKSATEAMDAAFSLILKYVKINGDQITLK